MAVLLSDVLPGSFFTTGTELPTQKYLLAKQTTGEDDFRVCYNLTQARIVEMAADTWVTELDLGVSTSHEFTI